MTSTHAIGLIFLLFQFILTNQYVNGTFRPPSCPNPVRLVRLKRGVITGQAAHWATSDFDLPSGRTLEGQVAIYDVMSQVANTHLLYECLIPGFKGNFISLDPNCEGQVTLRPSGYVYNDQSSKVKTAPIYRCFIPRFGDHFVSIDPMCEGQQTEFILGYYIVNPGVTDCYY